MRLRAGCIIGTAGGGNGTVNDSFKTVFEEGKNRVHPFVVPKLMNNAACSHICMEQGLMGPSFSVATACASSNHAIGLAFQMVRAGVADVMLAGGAEAMLNFGGLKAWEGLRVMSKDACRPFSLGRNGMVQGEGAGVFVLEDYESAKARGAEILCEIKGFAMSSDAGDIVMPSVIGAGRAISGARRMRGWPPIRSAISMPMARARRRMTRRKLPRFTLSSARLRIRLWCPRPRQCTAIVSAAPGLSRCWPVFWR